MYWKQVRVLLLLMFYIVMVPGQLQSQTPQIRFCQWNSDRAVQKVWWIRYQSVTDSTSNQITNIDDIYLQESFTVEGWNSPFNYYRRIIVFYFPVAAGTPANSKLNPEQHLVYYANSSPVTRLGEKYPDWRAELGYYGCIPTLKNHIESGAGQMQIISGSVPGEVENIPTRYLLSPIFDSYLPLPTHDGEYKDADYTYSSDRGYRVFLESNTLVEDLEFDEAVKNRKLGAHQYQKLEEFYRAQMPGWTVAKRSESQLWLSQDNKVIELTFDINLRREKLVIEVKSGRLVNGVPNFQKNQGNIDSTQCGSVIDTFTVDTSHEVSISSRVEGSLYCLSETGRTGQIRSKEVDMTVTAFLPAWLPGQP